MKKFLCMLLALMMIVPALAETTAALPVRILEHEEAVIPISEAITKAQQSVHPDIETDKVVRAELVELSDGKKAWVVTTFDTSRLTYAWYTTVDASTGEVLELGVSDDGFFTNIFNTWTEQKGLHALWSMEDKALFDALYAMLPRYGLPIASIPDGNALTLALEAVGLKSAEGYEVGYGYLMDDDGVGGMWEITLVQNGQLVYQVNLDGSEIYYIYPDEAGNG